MRLVFLDRLLVWYGTCSYTCQLFQIFFRRNVGKDLNHTCSQQTVNSLSLYDRKSKCSMCRLQRCLDSGMSLDGESLLPPANGTTMVIFSVVSVCQPFSRGKRRGKGSPYRAPDHLCMGLGFAPSPPSVQTHGPTLPTQGPSHAPHKHV